ncbi:Putative lumazine-binding [Rhizobiales bacterium GAS191]|nr:Putative lumazine-binding [Rhizobiales bacterium GAS191]
MHIAFRKDMLAISWMKRIIDDPEKTIMPDAQTIASLLDAVERYFDLMFDSDVTRFDHVFAKIAQLHGLRDAKVRLLTSNEYKALLQSSPSPKSSNAPRQQEILMVDFASPTQAIAKVRVRVGAIQYLDYLSYHRIDETWLITAKSFHVEQRFDS